MLQVRCWAWWGVLVVGWLGSFWCAVVRVAWCMWLLRLGLSWHGRRTARRLLDVRLVWGSVLWLLVFGLGRGLQVRCGSWGVVLVLGWLGALWVWLGILA